MARIAGLLTLFLATVSPEWLGSGLPPFAIAGALAMTVNNSPKSETCTTAEQAGRRVFQSKLAPGNQIGGSL